MKNKKFNGTDFLKITTLSPLESLNIKGGLADRVVIRTSTLSSVVVNITYN